MGRAQTPVQRMHHAFLLFAALVGFVAAVFNVVMGLSPLGYGIALAVTSLFILWMWYRSRWRDDYQRMAWWFSVLVIFVFIPVNWFFNQGMQGPTLLFFLMAAAYSLGLVPYRGWQRCLVIAGFLAMPLLLIVVEYRVPSLVAPYPSRAQQAADMIVSYYLNVAILLVLVTGHLARIKTERRRSQSYAARLEELARCDSLTGLLNHGAFHALAEAHLESVAHTGRPCCLLTCDLDHFKRINDTHGHPYGDRVIQYFADRLREVAGDIDGIVGRCGGEEFSVLLPGAAAQAARGVDGRLRELCRLAPMLHGEVHLSSGLAEASGEMTVAHWFERADKALYVSKANGRNRLVVSGTDVSLA